MNTYLDICVDIHMYTRIWETYIKYVWGEYAYKRE